MERYIRFKMFGKERTVKATIYNSDGTGEYDDTLWVENNVDLYALMSPQLKGKRVAVVERKDWLNADPDNFV
jgi:hypothetical protein